MPYLLHIETSAHTCSVCLSKNDTLIFYKESKDMKSHATSLALFINEGLTFHKLAYDQLDGVSVSMGPGSYTGLRIGVSTAKGICYAHDIPLIPVSTLKILTAMALSVTNDRDAYYCPMIDARRMEVYLALYNNKLDEIRSAAAVIIDEQSAKTFRENSPVYFFGDGAYKAKALIEPHGCRLIEDCYPAAKFMISEALATYQKGAFADTAYFEPHYLKEFIATKPKKRV